MFAAGAPGLLGGGIDVPDDTLYYDVASWEWLRHAARSGLDPLWVPGKLGGVHLFGDVVPMGPFYPAVWSALLMPVGLALPLMGLLHALGALLAVRWLAREVGASSVAATLAGAAVLLGPLGTFGFVDGRATAWAGTLWLPVILAAGERACRKASGARGGAGGAGDHGRAAAAGSLGGRGPVPARWRQQPRTLAALAGAALALLMLGSHIRFAATSCGLLALWLLVRRPPLVLVLGLVAGGLVGSLSVLPTLLEWGQATAPSRMDLLALPADARLSLANAAGWLAPRPAVTSLDYSLGAVLGAALVAAPLSGRATRALAAIAGLALAAAFSTEVPGARWVFAPLLALTHPVNDLWTATALVPAAALAALGLDRWLGSPRRGWRPDFLTGPRSAALGALLVAPVVLAVAAPPGGREGLLWGMGLAHAAVALVVLLRSRRVALVAAVALLDLGASSARIHGLAPSPDLDVDARSRFDVTALLPGFLDLDELHHTHPFAHTVQTALWLEEQPDWISNAAEVQDDLARRAVPPHLAVGRGLDGLSGQAKMPPEREMRWLLPLAERWQAGANADDLLAAGSTGRRVLDRQGFGIAVGRGDEVRWQVTTPRCWSAAALVVEPDPARRSESLLAADWTPGQPTLVEDEATGAWPVAPVQVDCPQRLLSGATFTTDSSAPGVVLLRLRHHPGWRVEGPAGPLPVAPADEVALAVAVPAGHHRWTLRFRSPGLRGASGLALVGVLGLGLLASPYRRRSRSASADQPAAASNDKSSQPRTGGW